MIILSIQKQHVGGMPHFQRLPSIMLLEYYHIISLLYLHSLDVVPKKNSTHDIPIIQ